tara:strand:- start:3718 stop:3924 length:207 start_codon:yes stop_codon:yes gene_type:complete
VSTSVIWIRALELHQRLDRKTSTNHSLGIVEFGSRLIAYLKQYLKIKDNEAPKYLQGKNKFSINGVKK